MLAETSEKQIRLEDLLTGAMKLCWKNFGLFLPLVLVGLCLPVIVRALWLADSHALWWVGAAILPAAAVMFFWADAALVITASNRQGGRELSLAECLREARGVYLWRLGVSVAYGLAVVIGLLAFVIPGILLGAAFCLAPCAAVLDRKRRVGAFRRSRELMGGLLRRVVPLIFLTGLLAIGLVFIEVLDLPAVEIVAISTVLCAVFWPVLASTFTILYLRLSQKETEATPEAVTPALTAVEAPSRARTLPAAVIVVFLLSLPLAAAGYYLTGDAPPPQDGDLAVQRPPAPDQDGAVQELALGFQELKWPEDGTRIALLTRGNTWNADFVRNLLESNAKSLERIERARKRPQLQIPETKGLGDPCAYAGQWVSLSYFLKIRSIFLLKQKKEEEALKDLFDIVNLGDMIENGGGTINYYLAANSIKNLGLEGMRVMLAETQLPADRLVRVVQDLAGIRPSEAGLINSFKAQYRLQKGYIDELAQGKADPKEGGLEKLPSWWRSYRRYLIQANRTKRILEKATRICIKNASLVYAKRDYSEMPQAPKTSNLYLKSKLLLSGNSVGRLAAGSLDPPFEAYHTLKCGVNVSVRATRILFALKAFKMEKGTLPESLNELAPKYIDAVPVDDFDGQPLRYSRENKILRSVGKNLEDSEGQDKSGEEQEDFVFPINF